MSKRIKIIKSTHKSFENRKQNYLLILVIAVTFRHYIFSNKHIFPMKK